MISRMLAIFIPLMLVTGLVQPAPMRAAPGNSDFGVNSHLGATLDAGRNTRPLDILAEVSAGWVREEFVWGQIEPRPGEFDWSRFDRVVDGLSSRGIKIIGLLNTAPGWATASGEDGASETSFFAPDAGRYAVFAAAAAARYRGKVDHWEIWNEPENGTYWRPAPDPAAYAALLRAAYPAIKNANPNATVLSGGVVPTASGFVRALANNNAWGSFDVLALHPYVDPFSPEAGQIGAGDVSAIKALADQFGAKPIWATEFGWSAGVADRDPNGVDEETQANYLVRAVALLKAAGVEKILWFRLKDTERRNGRAFNSYGLLRGGGDINDFSQPRPALTAFRVLNEQLSGMGAGTAITLGGQRVVVDFERFGNWRRGDQPNGELIPVNEPRRNGNGAAALRYSFPSGGNDYVVFTPQPAIGIPGAPSQLGIWINGDSSGHALKVWLTDAENETLQFRLGFIGGGGWQLLATPINGQVENFNRVSGNGNLRLDYPVRLTALVLDDEPDGASGSGTFYLDDMTAFEGPEAYGVRFSRPGRVVDVLWSPTGGRVNLPVNVRAATIVTRDGSSREIAGGTQGLDLDLSGTPIFVSYNAAQALPEPLPTPTVPPPPPITVDGPCRDFAETGQRVCGRILAYWNENGGLPVFGFPITPLLTKQVEGKPLQVQIFERNRLELHPANARPYDVLLGRLGADRLASSGRDWQQFPKDDPGAAYYFPQTGQAVAPEFQAYWASNGLEFDGRAGKSVGESLALFGLPLSPAIMETNAADGRVYLTQHFERARFEYHPENAGTPYVVLLGLLGRETTGIR